MRLGARSVASRLHREHLHRGDARLGPVLEQIFARTALLARKVGDDEGLLGALLGLQRCHFLRGQLADIERYESEVAEVVARLGDPTSAAMATVIGSSARLFRGQLAVARRPLTEASPKSLRISCLCSSRRRTAFGSWL